MRDNFEQFWDDFFGIKEMTYNEAKELIMRYNQIYGKKKILYLLSTLYVNNEIKEKFSKINRMIYLSDLDDYFYIFATRP